MKMRIDKNRIAVSGLCAVMIAAAAFVGMHFFKNAQRVIPQNPISQSIEPLTVPVGVGADGEGGPAVTQAEASEISDNTDSSYDSDKADTGDRDVSENSHIGANSDTDAGPYDNSVNQMDDTADKITDGSGNTVSTESRADSPSAADTDSSDGGQSGKPSQDIYSDMTPDGTTADREYFTTSIEDGCIVNEKVFEFTVTQLEKELTVRNVAVSVNGEAVTQFSGKCQLSEGKNIIRVQCTYTDADGKALRAYKDHTVYCYAGEIGFETDLCDKETNDPQLEFSAAAFYDEKEIPLTVTVNGSKVPVEESYAVYLDEGENKIVLSAEYNGKHGEKSFTVTYSEPPAAGLYTDLSDRTVYSSLLEFYAYFETGDGSGKITVSLNGEIIRPDGKNYSCTLKVGENVIRIKGKGGTLSCDETYVINYVQNDEQFKPCITKINLSDGQLVKGRGFTLILRGEDCDGNRIYSDRTEVYINGVRADCTWQDSDEAGYYFSLAAGANSLSVRLTDSLGRFRDYYYIINCQAVSDGEAIGSVSVSIDCSGIGLGTICSGEAVLYDGENGFDAVKRFLEENGFEYEVSGSEGSYYLRRIKKPGAFSGGEITAESKALLDKYGFKVNNNSYADSLGEYDYTSGSGWIYTLNGKTPNYGISQAHFADGDVIRLTFTLANGNDIS